MKVATSNGEDSRAPVRLGSASADTRPVVATRRQRTAIHGGHNQPASREDQRWMTWLYDAIQVR
jgi:hypothetical protein